jgi:predicted Co/Zn/Cd cation transporter (cation efflux family)
VDPILVLVVGGITIGVPVRLSWNALMELLNRTPSAELLAQIRRIIEESLEDLPVTNIAVRVLQPGRTRIISAHILLPSNTGVSLAMLDEVRARTDAALKAEYPTSVVDLLFTGDPRWSAPLVDDRKDTHA